METLRLIDTSLLEMDPDQPRCGLLVCVLHSSSYLRADEAVDYIAVYHLPHVSNHQATSIDIGPKFQLVPERSRMGHAVAPPQIRSERDIWSDPISTGQQSPPKQYPVTAFW